MMVSNNETNNKNYNHVLFNLQDYMLTDKFIQRLSIPIQEAPIIPIQKIHEVPIVQVIPKIQNDLFFPKEKDSLFWCFYIMKNGETKYEMLENKSFVIEKKFKIDYVEKIRKEKQIVKSHKFATLTHLENQLANEEKIDLPTFFTLCVIENINILYVCKKTYFELLMNDDKIHIIHRLDNYSKYGYEGIEQSRIELYRSTLFKVDSVEKPIKSISSYKVSELVEFCTKLGIEICIKDTNKNKSKKDLYESLIQYF
jgi:hypothetical protein